MKRLLLAAFLLSAPWLPGHEAHDSVTQAVLRPENGRLEVTVSVHVADIERALSTEAGHRLKLEALAATEAERLLKAYLRKTFLLESPAGERLKIHWVGWETAAAKGHEHDSLALLHFEMPLARGLEGMRIWQGILCEVYPDQINLVHLSEGNRKVTLGFSPGRKAREISFDK